MGNEMGNRNVSGIQEEENSTVEDPEKSFNEISNTGDEKGENHIVPEAEGKDFHDKIQQFSPNNPLLDAGDSQDQEEMQLSDERDQSEAEHMPNDDSLDHEKPIESNFEETLKGRSDHETEEQQITVKDEEDDEPKNAVILDHEEPIKLNSEENLSGSNDRLGKETEEEEADKSDLDNEQVSEQDRTSSPRNGDEISGSSIPEEKVQILEVEEDQMLDFSAVSDSEKEETGFQEQEQEQEIAFAANNSSKDDFSSDSPSEADPNTQHEPVEVHHEQIIEQDHVSSPEDGDELSGSNLPEEKVQILGGEEERFLDVNAVSNAIDQNLEKENGDLLLEMVTPPDQDEQPTEEINWEENLPGRGDHQEKAKEEEDERIQIVGVEEEPFLDVDSISDAIDQNLENFFLEEAVSQPDHGEQPIELIRKENLPEMKDHLKKEEEEEERIQISCVEEERFLDVNSITDAIDQNSEKENLEEAVSQLDHGEQSIELIREKNVPEMNDHLEKEEEEEKGIQISRVEEERFLDVNSISNTIDHNLEKENSVKAVSQPDHDEQPIREENLRGRNDNLEKSKKEKEERMQISGVEEEQFLDVNSIFDAIDQNLEKKNLEEAVSQPNQDEQPIELIREEILLSKNDHLEKADEEEDAEKSDLNDEQILEQDHISRSSIPEEKLQISCVEEERFLDVNAVSHAIDQNLEKEKTIFKEEEKEEELKCEIASENKIDPSLAANSNEDVFSCDSLSEADQNAASSDKTQEKSMVKDGENFFDEFKDDEAISHVDVIVFSEEKSENRRTPPLIMESALEIHDKTEKILEQISCNDQHIDVTEIKKSPSFDFGLSVEESDQTPLLCRHSTATARSLSSGEKGRFRNPMKCGREMSEYEDVSVEEKTIRMERSDSEKGMRAPFMSLLKKGEKDKEEDDEKKKNTTMDSLSSSNKEGIGKRKPWPSLFCICCAAPIH